MVELALVLPLLLLVLFGIMRFGLLFAQQIEVTNAARDVARKASVSRSTTYTNANALATARASTTLVSDTSLSVTMTPGQPWSAGSDVTVTVTHPYSVSVLGVVVMSGTLQATKVARVE
jgi:Flp pilus assembly protein TadG